MNGFDILDYLTIRIHHLEEQNSEIEEIVTAIKLNSEKERPLCGYDLNFEYRPAALVFQVVEQLQSKLNETENKLNVSREIGRKLANANADLIEQLETKENKNGN